MWFTPKPGHVAEETEIQPQLRPATAADAPDCGRICYEAFATISSRHGFPPDFPSVKVTTDLWSGLIAHPGFFGVVSVPVLIRARLGMPLPDDPPVSDLKLDELELV